MRPGFETKIAIYNPPWPPPRGPAAVCVVGSEMIETRNGEIEAWMVSYDAGGAPTTLWISARDRRFLRLRSELRGGAVFWQVPVADIEAWRRAS